MDNNQNYDLVFSVGGNCAAAHNLQYKGLRKFSLPFDWTYIVNDSALYKLAEGFKNNFKTFLLKENLEELAPDKYSIDHKDKIQYKDLKTEYYFVNHFVKPINNINEYNRVKNKFDKRAKRLIEFINKSNKILLILSTNFYVNIEPCRYLINTLNEIFPNKTFHLRVLSFSCAKDEIIEENCIKIYHYAREITKKDYTTTTQAWDFLDFINYNPSLFMTKFGCLMFDKLKKGLAIVIFPQINTFLYVKLYICGIRIQIAIGKNRIE